jgi:hypothetical protein
MTLPVAARAQHAIDSVQDADAAFEAGDLARALQGYDSALARGGLEHSRYAHVVSRMMLVRSARRDEAGTRAAARLFLGIDGLPIPPEMSRLGRAWLEAEGAAVRPYALLDTRPVDNAASGVVVQVRVHADSPVRLELNVGVRTASVLVEEPGEPWLSFSLAESLDLPADATVRFLDGRDNELAIVPLQLEPATTPQVVADDVAPETLPEPEREPEEEVDPTPTERLRRATWPDDLVVVGTVVSGVGLAAFAGFLTATWVGWDAFQRCASADCEAHLDWTPELADASLGVTAIGMALLLVGVLSQGETTVLTTARTDSAGFRW